MTSHSLTTIYCDAPSCAYWEPSGIHEKASVARENLKSRGWAVNIPDPESRTRKDYCPRHYNLSGKSK